MSPESTLQNSATPAIIVLSVGFCKCKSENGSLSNPEDQVVKTLQSGQWQQVSVNLSSPITCCPLRLNPLKQSGVADISAVALRGAFDNALLWSVKGPDELRALTASGTLTAVPSAQGQKFLRYISTGDDSQLRLPHLTGNQFNQPLILEIWIRVFIDPGELVQLLNAAHHSNASSDSKPQELEVLTQERDSIQAHSRKIQSELYIAKSDLRFQLEQTKIARSETNAAKAELERLVDEKFSSPSTLLESDELLKREHQQLRRTLDGVLASRSWRITAPMRKFLEGTRRH